MRLLLRRPRFRGFALVCAVVLALLYWRGAAARKGAYCEPCKNAVVREKGIISFGRPVYADWYVQYWNWQRNNHRRPTGKRQ